MLSGVRVLDFTQYLSGPSATRMLAAMGADVIKIEFGPTGDQSRQLPQVVGGRSAYYVQQNRGKRSVAVDQHHPEALDLLGRLARCCDVLTENFGPGVLDRRGLGYAELSADHPGLIYASITAFGKSGPLSSRPGYDLIGQALGGMMHLTGEPDRPPMYTGSPISDVGAGLTLFGAIGHALFHRERTGRGQQIDVSLVDPVFHMHSIAVEGFSATGGEWRQQRMGRHFDAVVPSGTFRSPEGWVVIQVLDLQWPRFAQAIGRPELADDPDYATVPARRARAAEVLAMVEAWTTSFPDDASLLAVLEEHRIAAAPVLDPADAIDHPYFTERPMVKQVPDAALGMLDVPGFPIRFGEREEPELDPPAPFAGEHNAAVLHDLLGLDGAEVNDLEAAGALWREPKPE
jgi:crotonobetainyl-CoA:carnitine CoA-transferase CaiB-like acyl-CoA transferase